MTMEYLQTEQGALSRKKLVPQLVTDYHQTLEQEALAAVFALMEPAGT